MLRCTTCDGAIRQGFPSHDGKSLHCERCVPGSPNVISMFAPTRMKQVMREINRYSRPKGSKRLAYDKKDD